VITLSATGTGGTATGTLTLNQPAAPPTISNYVSSPTSIPAGGGNITFTAAVTNASTCSFTVDSEVGIVASGPSSSCAGGTFSFTYSVPANPKSGGDNPRHYSFKLTVDGPGGEATSTILIQQPQQTT
jgi:hypothetical protein